MTIDFSLAGHFAQQGVNVIDVNHLREIFPRIELMAGTPGSAAVCIDRGGEIP